MMKLWRDFLLCWIMTSVHCLKTDHHT